MQIVGVITVGDCNMTTIWSVLMFVMGMFDATVYGAFVPIIVVLVMEMPVVYVIQVIVVWNCRMATIRTMNMRMFVLHNEIMPQGWSLRRKGVSQFAFENLS